MSIATRPKPLPKIVAPTACTLIPGVQIGVTVPMTPDTCLRPNARTHWAVRSVAARTLREAAYLATREVVQAAKLRDGETPFPADARLRVRLVIGWEKRRNPHDQDGAISSLKSALDGFADAIGLNDRQFIMAGVEQCRDAEGRGWVRIEGEVSHE